MKLSRRSFVKKTIIGAAAVATWPPLPLVAAAEPKSWEFKPDQTLIAAPPHPTDWPAYREQLRVWREQKRKQLKYDGSYYTIPEFAWASSNFACALVMMCDESFYSPKTGEYTLDAFLNHGRREFGGYDSIVLWHAYPRIGVDQRNQYDFYRDMPGGLPGVRKLVETAHARRVRVFINFNPWDLGTRREHEPDQPERMDDPTLPWRYTSYSANDVPALAEIVRALHVDGVFLDTMPWAPPGLRKALDAIRPGIVLEGEMPLHLEHVPDHHSSWAQVFGGNFSDNEVPGVLRNRWYERRHTMHLVDRWNTNHAPELQTAWMNGTGIMVWENVFGSWLGWSPRDRSMLRSMLPILRRFAGLFSGEHWTPLVPTEQHGIYASSWGSKGLRLWTLVNRTNKVVEGELLTADASADERYFDLVGGRELKQPAGVAAVSFQGAISASGIGCFLAATSEKLGHDFPAFLDQMSDIHQRADDHVAMPTTETDAVVPLPSPRAIQLPGGMIELPAATLEQIIEVRSRECGFYEGSHLKDVQPKDSYGFETVSFQRRSVFPRLAMDKAPVTNAQYSEFLAKSGYQPKHAHNYLKHWTDGKPPSEKEHHPVVWVDMEDARAYAKWTGKRLPTEEEWQYAAQGADGRIWPWGAKMEPGRCNHGSFDGTTPVEAFPEGRSPFGCYDMCGNVWQWTESERSDGHTRFVMIRGGSWYEAKSSGWYVTGGPRPANESTKFLLLWPGLDRCATIGFRCVKDME